MVSTSGVRKGSEAIATYPLWWATPLRSSGSGTVMSTRLLLSTVRISGISRQVHNRVGVVARQFVQGSGVVRDGDVPLHAAGIGIVHSDQDVSDDVPVSIVAGNRRPARRRWTG
jgi:hypothetical protein